MCDLLQRAGGHAVADLDDIKEDILDGVSRRGEEVYIGYGVLVEGNPCAPMGNCAGDRIDVALAGRIELVRGLDRYAAGTPQGGVDGLDAEGARGRRHTSH